MTTPTEKPFEPTPEQVAAMILQLRQACPHFIEFQLVAWFARQHLADLSTLRSQLDALKAEHKRQACAGETLTDTLTRLRSAADYAQEERDALKAEVVMKDGALSNLITHFEPNPNCARCKVVYVEAKLALTPAAMEANQPHNPDRHLEEIDDSGERSDL